MYFLFYKPISKYTFMTKVDYQATSLHTSVFTHKILG